MSKLIDTHAKEFASNVYGEDEFFTIGNRGELQKILIEFGECISGDLKRGIARNITKRKLCAEGKHFWKAPESLEEAKQPLKCRYCDARMKSGPGIDMPWTWSDEFLEKMKNHIEEMGLIITGSPLHGSTFAEQVNHFRIQDKKERQKHSPYQQMKRKKRGVKNGRTNDAKR